MTTYFAEKHLLKAPTKRAAFSDRTAYVMAEMSKLAYFKFEGGGNVDQFISSAKEILGDEATFKGIEVLARNFFAGTSASTSPEESKTVLNNILKNFDFELIEVFNNSGTQAFLCRHNEHKVAILAFRGTEVKEYADIRSDIDASLKEVIIGGHKLLVHSGYWRAFGFVKDSIEAQLETCKDCQLFFTGHSLGGALATVALKYFSSDATGACYTFGAPPVGTKDFENNLKTPLYRIINHLDIVPNLPNPFLAFIIKGISKLFMLILIYFRIDKVVSPKWREKIYKFIKDSSLYRQIGYGSFLLGTEMNPVLRYQLGVWEKGKMYLRALDPRNWWSKKRKMKRFLTDHSIEAYSTKLKGWAVSRQS